MMTLESHELFLVNPLLGALEKLPSLSSSMEVESLGLERWKVKPKEAHQGLIVDEGEIFKFEEHYYVILPLHIKKVRFLTSKDPYILKAFFTKLVSSLYLLALAHVLKTHVKGILRSFVKASFLLICIYCSLESLKTLSASFLISEPLFYLTDRKIQFSSSYLTLFDEVCVQQKNIVKEDHDLPLEHEYNHLQPKKIAKAETAEENLSAPKMKKNTPLHFRYETEEQDSDTLHFLGLK
jgi:hypothetical protein